MLTPVLKPVAEIVELPYAPPDGRDVVLLEEPDDASLPVDEDPAATAVEVVLDDSPDEAPLPVEEDPTTTVVGAVLAPDPDPELGELDPAVATVTTEVTGLPDTVMVVV